MAESWVVPGQWCDVTTFDKKAASGQVLPAWKDYCDCMFLDPVERVEFFCDGSPVPLSVVQPSPFVDKSQEAQAKRAQAYCDAMKGRYSIKVHIDWVRTEEWLKCMSNFCAVPILGCPNPLVPSITMPMNVHPGASLAPWTELGAAARGIRKRNAGFLYTLGQITNISISDYEPLTMWKNIFTNPALFELHRWKLNLIPGIGPTIANILGVPFPANAVLLAPLALTQCAIEQKSVVEFMFKPAATGGWRNAVFALQAIGPAIGQQYFALAGICLEKYAKDQIESGEIDKVLDPLANGIIRFFAASGAMIGADLQAAIGNGFDLKSAPRIIRAIETGLRAVGDAPALRDPTAKAILNTTANVMGVIAVVAEGFETYKSLPIADKMWAIADDVVNKLFGFRLTELKRAVLRGAADVQVLLEDAKRRAGGPVSVDTLLQALEAMGKAFERIVSVLTDISSKMDGALDKFNEQFLSFNQVLTVVGTDTKAAFNAAAGGQTATLPSSLSPTATALVTTTSTSFTKGTKITSSPAGTSASSPGSSQSASSAGALLLGAGLGFAVAGPIGALGGAALSMLTSSPPKQYAPPVQVAKVIETMQSNPQATIRQTTNIGPRLNLNLSGFDADYMMDTRARAPVVQPKQIDITASTDSLGPPPDYAVTRFIPQPVAPAQPPAPEPVPVVITEATPVPAPAPAPSPSPVAVGPARPAVFVPGSPTYIPPEKRGVLTPDEPVVSAELPPLHTKDKGGFNLWWLVVLGAAYKFAQARSTIL